MIKLVAIDIDGTLFNDQHEITSRVRNTIINAKNNGVRIVLCTGRPLSGIKQSLEQLDLISEEDIAITMNGAIVLATKNAQIIAATTLDKADLTEIVAFCNSQHTYVTYFDAEHMYVENREITPLICQDALLLATSLYYQPAMETAATSQIAKVMLLDEPAKIMDVMQSLPETLLKKYYIVRSVPYNLEFLQKNTSKGTALKQLAESLDISQSEVMAIGDAENDITMLKYAGTAVAMGNASAHVKEVASYTTTTNNDDGVATALEKFVL